MKGFVATVVMLMLLLSLVGIPPIAGYIARLPNAAVSPYDCVSVVI